jgi:CrcB protein
MSVAALQFLTIAVGGAIGGILRVCVSEAVARRMGEGFPWGTLVVNVSGAALIGVAAGISVAWEWPVGGETTVWALLVIGVLGSFTTVSAFSHQTLSLLHRGEPGRAALNIAASLGLCLSAVAAAYLGVGLLVGA